MTGTSARKGPRSDKPAVQGAVRASRRALLAALFLAVTAALSFGSGIFEGKPEKADWNKAVSGARVELTGTVRVVGNEPFPETVITDDAGGDWFLDEAGAKLLRGMEHRTVTVTGTVARKPMTLANGKKLEDRRLLAEVTVKE